MTSRALVDCNSTCMFKLCNRKDSVNRYVLPPLCYDTANDVIMWKGLEVNWANNV